MPRNTNPPIPAFAVANNGNDSNNSSSMRRFSINSSITSSIAKIEILFQTLGLESFGDLSSSSIGSDVVRNGITDSMNLAQCKKKTDKKALIKHEDEDRQGEADAQENQASQAKNKKTPKMHTRRRGVRRGTVDSCNGEQFEMLGALHRQDSKKQRFEYD